MEFWKVLEVQELASSLHVLFSQKSVDFLSQRRMFAGAFFRVVG